MMKHAARKRNVPVTRILLATFGVIAITGFAFFVSVVNAGSSCSASSTFPNGLTVSATAYGILGGGVGMSSNKNDVIEISIGGKDVDVTTSEIEIDGRVVAAIDSSAKTLELVSRNGQLSFLVDGSEAIPPN